MRKARSKASKRRKRAPKMIVTRSQIRCREAWREIHPMPLGPSSMMGYKLHSEERTAERWKKSGEHHCTDGVGAW